MPNIPIYNPSIPEINVTDRNASTAAEMARVVGSLGRESAQSIEKGFKEAQSSIETAGKTIKEHEDFADMQNGVKTFSDMSRRHDEEIRKTIGDNSIPVDQLPLRLAETYKRQGDELDQWSGQFGKSGNKVQMWALEHGEKYKTHLQNKFEADSSNAAGLAIGESVRTTLNNATADLGSNPTQPDLDHKLDQIDSQIGAVNLSPYMTIQQKKQFQDEVSKGKSEFIVSEVKKMLDTDPSQKDDLLKKYGSLISPSHSVALDEHARSVQNRVDHDNAQKGADALVQQYMGNSPSQTAIPNTGSLPQAGTPSGDDPRGMIPVVRALAQKYGHDPDVAVRVARSEGLLNPKGDNNTSFGTFQLHIKGGLGDDFIKQNPGVDPSDPKNEIATIDWAMKNLGRTGWEPYHGSWRTAGVGNWEGINRQARQADTTLAAQPPRGPSPVAPAAGNSIAVGDSIAWGLIKHGGLAGTPAAAQRDFSGGATASIGATPQMVLDNIKGMPDDAMKGKSIVLSTGASNDPKQVALVKDQIEALKAKGATNITVLGVGPRKDVAPANAELEAIAKDAGVKFTGPLKQTGADQIHPTRWRELSQSLPTVKGNNQVDSVNLNNNGTSGGSTMPPGMAEAGNIDLNKRPVVKNPDNTISTVRSISINEDGKEVLIPTVAADGSRVLSNQEAIKQYQDTGQFLGKFDNVDAANDYAKKLHEAQQRQYAPQNGQLMPMPSREQMLSAIPQNAPFATRKVYEETIDKAISEMKKRTEDDRSALGQEIKGGVEKLANGNDYDWNENTIRHYFEPKIADKVIAQLDDAKAVGKQIGEIRETPVTDIFTNMVNLKDSLKTIDAADYPEHYKLVAAYQGAAEKHLKALGLWPGQHDADKADVVSYLTQTDPNLRDKLATLDMSKPESVQEYTQSMLTWQQHLGIPAEHQHLLSISNAQNTVHQIESNPQQAANTIMQLRSQWGNGFDHVWSDLVTLGKMNASYQLMGALDDPHDQYMLARGLTEQITGSKGGGENFWENFVGKKSFGDIQKTIREDDTVKKFMVSMANSNGGGTQLKSLMGAIDTLGFSNAMFGGDDAGTAAGKAIKSAIGHYSFIGNARVPTSNFDSVSKNVNQTMDNIKTDSITIPDRIGGVGQASADNYVSLLKANPSWVTNQKEDAIILVDNGGRFVRDKSGNPITVKFGTPSPASTPQQFQAPPYSGL